ncbi:putative phosphatidylinositol phosphate kinase [Tieghemostelium lacteum]|uniref:Putative phosphatidylinositol phosphate kinase n=1 Tax=Tieghemostelium lacteum TaxID=361077 RepID=A0A151Z666_TIELA|nr:putative phosphatidylinositol phosphate kinase [Tieghemostelium lacteum]|eukprot:KYQ89435.1 putative phosphatidylinositol phosphate kinase [Tieghemostelium lacteum]
MENEITIIKPNRIGESINKEHRLWNLMINLQTGIRYSVGKNTVTPNNNPGVNNISTKEEEDLQNSIYTTPEPIYFSTKVGSIASSNSSIPFTFTQFAPMAFDNLRTMFSVDKGDFMLSLCNTIQSSGDNSLRCLPSPGKSGSVFLFSDDMKFIMKTIPSHESKLLLDILPDYVNYIKDNLNTLLPKFFGLYKIKQKGYGSVRIVVLENLFRSPNKIHERYDLKGSLQGRETLDRATNSNTTLKDMDFRNDKKRIQIQQSQLLIEQLKKDSNFLSQLNIMDYSLLIGIHKNNININTSTSNSSNIDSNLIIQNEGNSQSVPSLDHISKLFELDGSVYSKSKEEIYYLGVIDILVEYTFSKKLAHFIKTIRYGKEQEISTVSPNEYAIRFQKFMESIIE